MITQNQPGMESDNMGGPSYCQSFQFPGCAYSWLASCLTLAVERRTEEGRLISQSIVANNQEWPDHELLLPSAIAMTLS